jgi:SAM-dependent methyltransferase
MGTDRDWEQWGRQDPYFAVITHEKYRRRNLDPEALRAFFESGRGHVERVLGTCRERLDPDFAPRRALDFGCGTGRLLPALAASAGEVVGVDVSDAMLAEARRNCDARSLANVALFKSDDGLSQVPGRFDFIHCFIVFQHIPVARGIPLFARLLDRLEDGGIAAVQFTYAKRRSRRWRLPGWLDGLARKALGRRDPAMQMNPYPLGELVRLIQDAGAGAMHVEFTDHSGELGVFLYFRKQTLATR